MAELWTTRELPGIRWDPADEPDDDCDDRLDDPRLHDLRGQGLTVQQLHDELTGSDRDLLGQHAAEWRLLAATTVQLAQEDLL